eukprot:UN4689
MMFVRDSFGVQFTYVSDPPHIKSDSSVAQGKVGGEIFPSPEVLEDGVTLGGRRTLFLDEYTAPNGFTLVVCGGGGVDAYEAKLQASEETLKLLQTLGAAVVAVAPYSRWSSRKAPSSSVPVMDGLRRSGRCMDAKGYWTKWTRKNDLEGKILVVRPDRYIFGDFRTVDEVGRALEAALRRTPSQMPDKPKTDEL